MRVSLGAKLLCAAFAVSMLAIGAFTVGVGRAYALDRGYPVVVSMGDSYSSGEGTEPFFCQDLPDLEKFDHEDFLAHRSEHAWSGQLEVNGTKMYDFDNHKKSPGWYFVAASGAQTKNIIDEDQWIDWSATPSAFGRSLAGTHKCSPQIEVINQKNLQGKVDYVTLTIGGNDTPDDKELGFANIVKAAAWDNRFTHGGALTSILEEEESYFDKTMKNNLLNAYSKILDKAGPQATLIVAGYPHLFSSADGLGIYISADDAKKINKTIDYFDETMKSEIGGLESIEFADPRDEFNTHESEYINGIMLGRCDQEIWASKVPPISNYSVHPNEHGQAAYARVVQKVISELESGVQDVDVDSDVAMSLVFDVSGSMNDPSAMSGMTKLASAKRQSSDFVSSVAGEKEGQGGLSMRVGVCSFSSTAETNCGLSNDPGDINASIAALDAGGQTNMYAGLNEGIAQLMGENGPRLMVFLSDGLSNVGGSRADILDLAQEAADEDIKIYTIGFGSSSDVDEDLLQEIADITGGEYSHEDSASISSAAVGLFATMMNARLKAQYEILSNMIGAVGLNLKADAGAFDITKNGTVQVYLYWPGSVLDMQLTDPDGTEVAEGYSGCTIDASAIPTSITIENAKQGTWSMSVFGREVSMAEEPFYAVAAFEETEAPVAAAAGGGGGASNGAEGLVFIVLAAAVGCIVGVYAFTKRRSAHE